MNSVPETQLKRLQERFPESALRKLDDGSFIVIVPKVKLPDNKWSKRETSVGFVVPLAYPMARPDCFWADGDLRLRNGGMPMNAQFNNAYSFQDWLWFSYHPTGWDPARDDLLTYVNLIKRRFDDAR